MKRRWLLWVLLPCLLILSVLLLLFSPPGLEAIRGAVNGLSGGRVHVERVSGALWHHFVVEGIAIGTEQPPLNIDRLEVRWKPLALATGTLHLQSVHLDGFLFVVDNSGEPEEKRDESESFTLPSLPPFAVEVDDFTATSFHIDCGVDEDGEPNTSFFFDSIQLAFSVGAEGVTVRRFFFDGPDKAFDMRGALTRQQDGRWRTDFGGDWRFTGFGFKTSTGTLRISGDGVSPDLLMTLSSPGSLTLAGKLYGLTGQPRWLARLTGGGVNLAEWINSCPEILIRGVDADLYGDFSHYAGHAHLSGDWDFRDNLELDGEFDGNAEKIDLVGLRVTGGRMGGDNGGGEMALLAKKIELSWKEGFSWRGDVELESLDMAVIDPQLDGVLTSRFTTFGTSVDDQLDGWFDIAFFDGTLHGQPVELAGRIDLGDGAVSTEQVVVRSGGVEGRAVIGPAHWSWQHNRWQGRVLFETFNPAVISPLFPGRINGEIETAGRLGAAEGAGVSEAELKLTALSGEVRGQRLDGGGSFSWRQKRLFTEGFSLGLGRSLLELSPGDIATEEEERLHLDGRFVSPDLGEILPGAAGRLAIEATAAGTLARPQLQVELSAQNLLLPELAGNPAISLATLSGDGKLDGLTEGRVRAKLTAEGLRRDTLSVGSFEVAVDGSLARHNLKVALDSLTPGSGKGSSLSLGAVGGWNSSRRLWSGTLGDLEVTLPQLKELSPLRQQGGAGVDFGAEGAHLAGLCVDASSGRLCIDGGWQRGQAVTTAKQRATLPVAEPSWSLSASLTGFDPGLLLKDVDQLQVNGTLSAELEAEGRGGMPEKGRFTLDLPAAVLNLVEGEVPGDRLSVDNTRVRGSFEDGELNLTGESSIGSSGLLVVDATVETPDGGDFTAIADSPLSGSLSVDNLDVDLLAALLPEGQPEGELTADFEFSGTLAEPKATGNVALDGSVGILSQGLNLTGISSTVEADRQRMRFKGGADSGNGRLKVAGEMDWLPEPAGSLQISGRNVTAINTPACTLAVNPQLNFSFTPKGGTLGGTVSVASGQLDVSSFTSSVSTSDDVVLVEMGEEQQQRWPLTVDLRVALEDAVDVIGYGLSGRLGGAVDVKMRPDEPVTAKGKVQLKGAKVAMYGRSLDIQRGDILFSGGPVDNPGINLRAQKSVSDQQAMGGGYTVGLDVTGLARELHYRLFSSPPMSETEILSYLLLGHSLAGADSGDESILTAAAEKLGLAGGSVLLGDLSSLLVDDVHLEGSANNQDISLVVGKRISKDIYVGYDVNMFSQVGEFWIRYSLKHGFSVETHSSSVSTGGDLLFTFEK